MSKSVIGIATLVLLGLSVQPNTVNAAAGRTLGSATVSQTGGFTYHIPIQVPPGPHGIQPNLSLDYNSQSSLGIVGVGWALSGLSSITRCNLTYAQDGAPAAVTLNTSDGYCLDGKRLRLTGGQYGTAGSTYQTEVADFSLTTAYQTQGNGPQYFRVKTKDGLTYEYGYTTDSRVLAGSTAYEWLLDKVTDPSGNTYLVRYGATNTTNSAIPSTISYTASTSGSTNYNYEVTFYYGNAGSIAGYLASYPVTNTNILTAIMVTGAGFQFIKNYTLTYQTSPTTNRPLLSQVQECADVERTICLPPTVLTYQDPPAGIVNTSTTALSAPIAISTPVATLTGKFDFNGDGFSDFAYVNASTNVWYVAFGSASGFASPINTGITANGPIGRILGTTAAGFVSNVNGTWWYYSWNVSTSTFTGVSTGAPYIASYNLPIGTSYVNTVLADVNGDGLPDLVTASPTGISIQLNTSTGTTPSFSSTISQATTSNCFCTLMSAGSLPTSALTKMDFDGDGREDILMVGIVQNVSELLSRPNNTFASVPETSGFPSGQTWIGIGNFNEDACTDLMVGQTMYFSACDGTAGGAVTIPSSAVPVAFMDWNGDGLTDLIVGGLGTGSPASVYVSTGTGVTNSAITTSLPTNILSYFVLDQNGDGLDDLGMVLYSPGSLPTAVYYLHNGAGTPPDLLTSVTDGYGNSVSPSYVSIAQSNYSMSNSGVYPDVDFIGPLYVVSQTSSTDPSSTTGGMTTQSFWYYGARTNVQGRGFDGFAEKRTTDSRNGLYSYQYFKQSFPYTGALSEDDLYQPNGTTPISHTVDILDLKTLDNTANNQRYFPFKSQSTQQSYEVGGNENSQLITTSVTNYAYDNYGNATNVATTITDNDPGSPYSSQQWTTTTATSFTPDTSANWCLNLPTGVTVTNTAPLVPAITRTVSYPSPDYVHCRESQTVTEPAGGTYSVTEVYGYDVFGNLNGVATTGAGMTVRTTSSNWGATGQFQISTTNALSQTTQNTYDPNFGVLLSTTDPNNISTSWQYDTFGRKTQETRPDGTYTVWTYNDCASADGCLFGAHALTMTQTDYNADHSVLTDSTRYFDTLDRPLVSKVRNLAGGYDRTEVRYDSLGRVHQQSMPCTWSGLATPCSYWTTYDHDMLNRETAESRPINSTNGTLQATTIAYQGRTTLVTDPQGKQTTKITTVAGTLGRSQDHNGYYQNFTYDAFGSLLTVTDSQSNLLSSNIYAYGVAAFKTGQTDMDLGSWGYSVNALGEVTAYTDANGASFNMLYDALSRPSTRTNANEGTTTWTWGNNAASFNIGKLYSVSSTNGTTEYYTYDSKGRISDRNIVSDASYSYDYTYNAATGLLDTLTYPTSTLSYRLKLQYGYQNGILNQVKDFNAATVFWQANAVNSRGQVTQETLGNGLVTHRSFDAVTGWINNIQCGISGGTCSQNQSYLFDEVGNLTQRQNNNLGLTENFYYDNLYRLSYSQLNGITNLSMSYDVLGNITSKSDVAGGAAWTYSPIHKHQVTQAGSPSYTYSYDFNGNAVIRNGYGITWSKYNYPTQISGKGESTNLYYDANQARWKQVYTKGALNETTIYIGGPMEKVSANGVDDYREYISANGQTVAIMSRTTAGSNTTRYLIGDVQGSVAKITDSSGAEVVSESFNAFGTRRNPATWSGVPTNGDQVASNGVTREGYTGQDALGTLGLNHMNGRVQDGITGRFLSADPYISEPGNTQNYNRYSYANNNPLSFTDPSGFDSYCDNSGFGGAANGDPLSYICLDSSYAYREDGIVVTGQRPPPPPPPGPIYVDPFALPPSLFNPPPPISGPSYTPPPPVKQTQKPEIPCDQPSGASSQAAASSQSPSTTGTTTTNNGGNHLSSGLALSGSTVNPFTSSGGGVWGRNNQSVPGSTTEAYNYSGYGHGFDVGGSLQSVWAWGNGTWTGTFKSLNVSVGLFSGSVFWTPGDGGWTGLSFGFGLGFPGASYEVTNYTCRKK